MSSSAYDTFFNYDNLVSLQNRVTNELNAAKKFIKHKRLEYLNKVLPYKYVFETKGVNGVAGICALVPPKKVKGKAESNLQEVDIVFKVGLGVNHYLDNEVDILKEIFKLREFCPNFMAMLGYIDAPISMTFIEDNEKRDDDDSTIEAERGHISSESESDSDSYDEKWQLWDEDDDFINAPVIFLEYINNLTFYHVCKHGDRQQILATLYQTLAALVIGQEQLKLTHYDLHMDNVLLKPCDPNVIMVYFFDKDRWFVTPTHGNLSVIIDWGNSFCGSVQNKRHRGSIQGYYNGHCTSYFDSTYDANHLLFSSLYYLEARSDRWRQISTKLMMSFKNWPIWRQKGWRKLPNHLMRKIVKRVTILSRKAKKSEYWKHYAYELIELLTSLNDVPFEDKYPSMPEEEVNLILKTSFDVILENFEYLWDDENCTDELNINKAFKIIVDLLYNDREAKSKAEATRINKSFVKKFYTEYEQILEKVPKEFNCGEVIDAVRSLKKVIPKLLLEYNALNMSTISEAEKNTEIKDTYQLMKELEKWASGEKLVINSHSVFMVSDCVNKKMWRFPASELGIQVSKHPLKTKRSIAESIKSKIFS